MVQRGTFGYKNKTLLLKPFLYRSKAELTSFLMSLAEPRRTQRKIFLFANGTQQV